MSATLSPADLKFDAEHIWHPYTSMIDRYEQFAVDSAQGCKIKLSDGRELIDGMSSWWSAIHGYGCEALDQALLEQSKKMSHVMFGGLTHKPAIDLCRALVDMSPAPLQQVFLADSGSVAVEVALKMAIQYWHASGRPEKTRMLAPLNGYHGDTFGAMAVCDPQNGMHELFSGVLAQHHFAPAPEPSYQHYSDGQPWDEACIAEFESQLKAHHNELAAVILEPIVQGAGGMRFYSPLYLKRVRELCDEYEVLLIIDEVATGFGRTGRMFACEHAGISGDIMCVGKALTGGYMTLAATLCTDAVSQQISREGVFMHGPTFMANPLACAVANASLTILRSGTWQAQVAAIETQLRVGLAPCAELDAVAEVRVLGAIGVVELKEPVNMAQIQPRFVDEGVWVRPFGRLVYVMPQYIIDEEDLTKLTQAIYRVVSQL